MKITEAQLLFLTELFMHYIIFKKVISSEMHLWGIGMEAVLQAVSKITLNNKAQFLKLE